MLFRSGARDRERDREIDRQGVGGASFVYLGLLESYFEIFMLPKNENALLTPENKKVNLNFVGGDWNG